VYEYQVPVVRHNILLLFVASIAFTIFNIVVLQAKVPSSEAVLLGGLEVSAVCCARRRSGTGQKPSWRTSNMEGKSLVLWCEVVDVTRTQRADPSDEMLMEIRCLQKDPRKVDGRLLDAQPSASGTTRSMTAEDGMLKVQESVFLPIKYAKADFVQVILRDAASYAASSNVLAQATLPLSQAFRFNRTDANEQRLRLEAIGNGPSRAVARVRFRCLSLDELVQFRAKVKDELDDGSRNLFFFEQQLLAVQHMAAAYEPENYEEGNDVQT
jgi:hypothetical protein